MTEQDIPQEEPTQNNCKLYVSNLDATFSNRKIDSDLRSLFEKFGSIVSISVRRNDKANKVFAFVLYKNSQQANEAIQNLNGEYFGDMRLKVELQRGKREAPIRDTRQGNTINCYRCGKAGHFARFCTEKINKEHVDRDRKDSRRKGRSRDRVKRQSVSSSSSSSSSSRRRGKKESDSGRGRRRRSNSSSSSSGSK